MNQKNYSQSDYPTKTHNQISLEQTKDEHFEMEFDSSNEVLRLNLHENEAEEDDHRSQIAIFDLKAFSSKLEIMGVKGKSTFDDSNNETSPYHFSSIATFVSKDHDPKDGEIIKIKSPSNKSLIKQFKTSNFPSELIIAKNATAWNTKELYLTSAGNGINHNGPPTDSQAYSKKNNIVLFSSRDYSFQTSLECIYLGRSPFKITLFTGASGIADDVLLSSDQEWILISILNRNFIVKITDLLEENSISKKIFLHENAFLLSSQSNISRLESISRYELNGITKPLSFKVLEQNIFVATTNQIFFFSKDFYTNIKIFSGTQKSPSTTKPNYTSTEGNNYLSRKSNQYTNLVRQFSSNEAVASFGDLNFYIPDTIQNFIRIVEIHDNWRTSSDSRCTLMNSDLGKILQIGIIGHSVFYNNFTIAETKYNEITTRWSPIPSDKISPDWLPAFLEWYAGAKLDSKNNIQYFIPSRLTIKQKRKSNVDTAWEGLAQSYRFNVPN